MRVQLKRLVLILIFSAILQGCVAGKSEFTKETLNSSGLVVAEVQRLNSNGSVDAITGSPTFSVETVSHKYQNGHLVVALPPGKHTLKTIRTVSGSKSTTYAINLSFDVKAGSVTSLGKLILLMEEKKGSSRYRIIPFNNDKHILNFVRSHFPEASVATGGRIIKPDIKQMAIRDMDKLQIVIARRKMITGNNTLQQDSRNYVVFGGLGTLVRFTMSQDLKKFEKVHSLNTNTLDPLVACDIHKKIIACLTDSPKSDKVLIVEGNKVGSRKLNDNSFSKLFFGPDGGIVLMNNQFVLMHSKDQARSWKLDKRFYREQESSSALDMVPGRDGFYLYKRQREAPVIKYNQKTGHFSQLKIPFDSNYLTTILETNNGIYIGPEFTLMSNAKIYYLANSKSSWQQLEVPYSSCSSLKMLDKGIGKHLQLNCSSALKVESRDGGKNWYSAR